MFHYFYLCFKNNRSQNMWIYKTSIHVPHFRTNYKFVGVKKTVGSNWNYFRGGELQNKSFSWVRYKEFEFWNQTILVSSQLDPTNISPELCKSSN